MTNPLYRYLHGKKTKSKPKIKTRRLKIKRRVFQMARRRSNRRHAKRGGAMGGINSLARSALIGVGTAHFAGYIPVNVPFKEELAGAAGAYLIGGKNIKSAAVGAAAVFAAKMLSGQSGVSGGSSNAYGF